MNVIIKINGDDVTDACLLGSTRIATDSSKRITTAQISVMGEALGRNIAVYDSAHYDFDSYSIDIKELAEVEILDGRDGVTKLFDGQIYAMALQQSDAPTFTLFYQCDLNDWSAYLDRSVCWDPSFGVAMPNSDQGIIRALLGRFCPRIELADIAMLVPTIQKFDWATKTCRQVLDDMSTLSMGSWRVDFDAKLHYYLAADAPAAPFGLSTSPDFVTTFPVKVDNYKRDFTNPVNHAYVRGAIDPTTGVAISAEYADPVSIERYGDYAAGVVDTQIVTGWDAALKAKSTVLASAYPIETGNFTIWGLDGLACGMKVHIHEDSIGFDGDYTIRSLTMQWVDADTVVYTAQFGEAQPDLETILRLLDQRSKWQTSMPTTASSAPPPGSITDGSIAPPGLSASSIYSVNASTIIGQITAGQIGSINASTIIGQISASQIATVNAGSIVGTVAASQIGAVNASTIQGVIQAGQIGSVNATVIQGVVVSSQLADSIVDDLAKYATALRPVVVIDSPAELPALPNANFPAGTMFYYSPDGNFYQITPNGLTWVLNNNPASVTMKFYNIGKMSAGSITGLILAAQINSITAGQITGQIQAAQIGAVNASVIAGQITAGQISSVNASVIQGSLSGSQIGTINATQITGQITAAQIATVNAGQITGAFNYTQIGSINAATITIGLIQDNQVGNISGAKLTVGTVDSDKLNATAINVGGGGSKPGVINIYDGSVQLVAQVGALNGGGYGGWFKLFGAGGTGYNDSKVKTDPGGNLSIMDAALTITNPNTGTQLATGPQVFDSTYSSITLTVSGGSDKAQIVSRGFVLTYGGTRIASIARSPSGGFAVLELQGGGGYANIDGSSGVVRGDGGFQVAGTVVINNQAIFQGAAVSTGGYCRADGGFRVGGVNCIDSGGTFRNGGIDMTGSGINIHSQGMICGAIQIGLQGGFQPYVVFGSGFPTGSSYTKWIEVHNSAGTQIGIIPIF